MKKCATCDAEYEDIYDGCPECARRQRGSTHAALNWGMFAAIGGPVAAVVAFFTLSVVVNPDDSSMGRSYTALVQAGIGDSQPLLRAWPLVLACMVAPAVLALTLRGNRALAAKLGIVASAVAGAWVLWSMWASVTVGGGSALGPAGAVVLVCMALSAWGSWKLGRASAQALPAPPREYGSFAAPRPADDAQGGATKVTSGSGWKRWRNVAGTLGAVGVGMMIAYPVLRLTGLPREIVMPMWPLAWLSLFAAVGVYLFKGRKR